VADGKTPQLPPGITLKDVRLAIRIEKLFSEVYLPDGRGRGTGEKQPGQAPETLAMLKALEVLS
jgi:hypothetical protein